MPILECSWLKNDILTEVLSLPEVITVASEAYHDWSGEAAGARLRVNFMQKLLLSQNFCNRPLMRFISFASNIGPVAAVPAGPAPVPLNNNISCDNLAEWIMKSLCADRHHGGHLLEYLVYHFMVRKAGFSLV